MGGVSKVGSRSRVVDWVFSLGRGEKGVFTVMG